VILVLSLLVQGLGLGFTAAVQPGPFQAYLLSETLAHGWRRSLPIIFAPLLADGPVIAITLFILIQLPASVLRLIQIAGGLFILYLAWSMFRQLRRGVAIGPAQQPNADRRSALLRGVMVNLFSPAVYLFWGTISGPIVIKAWQQSPVAAIAFMVGFYSVIVGTMAVLVAVFQQARRLDERVVRLMLSASLVILVVLGGLLLKSGVIG
jgi:threonine/homoserine/homoserine lactone efflux protein